MLDQAPDVTIRTAKEIIDETIKENNSASWILYLFAIAFVAVGLLILLKAVFSSQNIFEGVGGFACSNLCWPAESSVRRTRKENIAIRMLEIPLNRTDTAKEAAEMIGDLHRQIMSNGKLDGKVK